MDRGYVAVFQTKKIRLLRGASQRIFGLSHKEFETVDPSDFTVTNTYTYDKLIDIRCSQQDETEFILEIREQVGKRSDNVKFRCEHRADLLTALVQLKAMSETTTNSVKLVTASRHKRNGAATPTFLVNNYHFRFFFSFWRLLLIFVF